MFSLLLPLHAQWKCYTNKNRINDFTEYNGKLWCATNGGVLTLDLVSLAFDGYTPADGLGGAQIQCVALDPKGVLWFGSAQGFITSFDGSRWRNYYPFASAWNLKKMAAVGDYLVIISDSALSFFHTPSGEIKMNMPTFGRTTAYTALDTLQDIFIQTDTLCVDTGGKLYFHAAVLRDARNSPLLHTVILSDTLSDTSVSDTFPVFQCKDSSSGNEFVGDTIIVGMIHLLGFNYYLKTPLVFEENMDKANSRRRYSFSDKIRRRYYVDLRDQRIWVDTMLSYSKDSVFKSLYIQNGAVHFSQRADVYASGSQRLGVDSAGLWIDDTSRLITIDTFGIWDGAHHLLSPPHSKKADNRGFTHVTIDSRNRLWVTEDSIGLIWVDGGNLKCFTNPGPSSNYLLQVVPDQNNEPWAIGTNPDAPNPASITSSENLVLSSRYSGSWNSFQAAMWYNIPDAPFFINTDKYGRIWITIKEFGIFVFNTQNAEDLEPGQEALPINYRRHWTTVDDNYFRIFTYAAYVRPWDERVIVATWGVNSWSIGGIYIVKFDDFGRLSNLSVEKYFSNLEPQENEFTDAVYRICPINSDTLWYSGVNPKWLFTLCISDGTHHNYVALADSLAKKADLSNTVEIDSGIPSELREGTRIRAIETAPDGGRWLCTDQGLFTLRARPTGWKWDTIGALHHQPILDMVIDDYGNKWVATDQEGMVRVAAKNDSITYYNTYNSGILSNTITSVSLHRESGTVWAGTKYGLCSFQTAVTAPIPPGRTYYLKSALVLSEAVQKATGRVLRNAVWCDMAVNSSIEIFSLSGKRVKNMLARQNTVEWDGLNDAGEPVAGGVYLFYVKTPAGNQSLGKIVVLR